MAYIYQTLTNSSTILTTVKKTTYLGPYKCCAPIQSITTTNNFK